MNPQEAARRRAIAAPAPQAQQMPFGSIRLHVISNASWLPASPLEGGAVPQYGDIELHIATLGHAELQVLPFGIQAAEAIHEKLGQAIARAKRAAGQPAGEPTAGERGMPDDIPPFSGDGPILHPNGDATT
jgi:hypothetical protein